MSYLGCWSACDQREDPERAPKNIYDNPTLLPQDYDSGRKDSEDGERDGEAYDSRDEDSYDISPDDLDSDYCDDGDNADGG
jgi:hypothetical protein